jgi:predicted nucleic acid-binding Zn ribbon protein
MLICEPATPAQGRSCAVCLTPINHKPSQAQTCGRLCGAVLGKAKADATRHANAMARRQHTCRQCGEGFVRRAYGKAGENQFCSRVCSAAAIRKYATEAEARRAERDKARDRKGLAARPSQCRVCQTALPGDGTRRLSCSRECGMEWARRAAYQENRARAEAWLQPRVCRECQVEFTPAYGAKMRLFCSKPCRRKSQKRVARHLRRARTYAAGAESFKSVEVFVRDGWRCHLCSRLTRPALRGTTHPRAPELDHIVPLAAGGLHTRANTACACRQCNNRKGAAVGGQPSLLALLGA